MKASFFEVTAAAAFLAFARTPADAVILEVGLGGRLDATNVIDRPLVTAIASLGARPPGLSRRHARSRSPPRKPASPSATSRSSPNPIRPTSRAASPTPRTPPVRCSSRAARAGRSSPTPASFIIATRRASSTLPLPRLPGDAPDPQRRARRRHAPPPVAARGRHRSRLAHAMTATTWPARLQRLDRRPARRPPPARQRIVDRRRPQPRRRAARRRLRPHRMARRPAADPAVRQPQVEGRRRHPRPVQGHRGARPDLAHPRPRQPRPGRTGRDGARHGVRSDARTPTSMPRSPPISEPARVLVFGSLYLAGVALSSNGSLPD